MQRRYGGVFPETILETIFSQLDNHKIKASSCREWHTTITFPPQEEVVAKDPLV